MASLLPLNLPAAKPAEADEGWVELIERNRLLLLQAQAVREQARQVIAHAEEVVQTAMEAMLVVAARQWPVVLPPNRDGTP
jgi:hypothetical protein